MAFVALATNPANAAKTYIFYVLMNPDKLGKPGFRAQITWVSWFLESSEPSSMGFVPLETDPKNTARTWLFICFNEPN